MRAVRLGVWAGGAALCVVTLVGGIRNHVFAASFVGNALSTSTGEVFVVPRNLAYAESLVALITITLGVLVWERRPDSRTGILLTAFPIAGLVTDPIVFAGSRLAVTVGLAAAWLNAAIAAHLLLSYPTGRFTSRLDRGFVAVAYGFALVSAVPFLLFFDPRTPHYRWLPECYSCALPLTHVAWHDVTEVRHVLSGVLVVLIVLFVVLLLRKIVRAVPVARSVALPLAFVAFVAAARFATLLSLRLVVPSSRVSWSWAWDWSAVFVGLAIAVVLAAGMLWGGAGRGAVADLVIELERTPPGSVRDALARALGDPSLDLALWLPERRAYVDSEGRPLELPAANTGRAVTVLGPAEAPVAALVHDPALLERPGLLTAAGPRLGSRSRTSGCRPSCGCSWRRSAPRAPASSPPATRSAGDWSATCTTARSNGCSASALPCSSLAQSSARAQTARPHCSVKPRPSSPPRSRSCASWRRASTRRC